MKRVGDIGLVITSTHCNWVEICWTYRHLDRTFLWAKKKR